MDNKRLIVVVILAFALVLIWTPIMNLVAQRMGWETTQQRAERLAREARERAATQPSTTQPAVPNIPFIPPPVIEGATPATTTQAPSVPGATTSAAGSLSVVNAAPESTFTVLGGDDQLDRRSEGPFAMRLELSSQGAGIESITLRDYRSKLWKDEPFVFEKPLSQNATVTRPLATRSIIVDGQRLDLAGVNWRVESVERGDNQQRATFAVDIARDGTPILRVRKFYTLFDRGPVENRDQGPMGFEPRVRYAIENLTDRPINAQLVINGPMPPPSESERYYDVYFLAGFLNPNNISRQEAWMASSISAEPVNLLENEENDPPIWTGSLTTYFAAFVRFEMPEGATRPADVMESAQVVALRPEASGMNREKVFTLTTKPQTVQPGATTELAMRAYFGPRKREVLGNAYYDSTFLSYRDSLIIAIGPCWFCTFHWLIGVLVAVLNFFHMITFDWGLAIVGLVIVVRLLLHPISRRAQLNMLKFAKIGPEIEKLRKKYGDNKEELNKAMMEVYRQQGAAPILGCLPLFLQMPIWIALWQALVSTFELRHAPFLFGLTWIDDLSMPDHLINFEQAFGWEPIHLPFMIVISGVNVLPFVFGILQYIQFKIQPKPAAMTKEQEQQQKITQWMILIMMPILLYGSPSGVTIYMITSFLIGIWESKRVRREFEAMEAQAARFSAEGRKPEQPKGRFGKWMAQMQERAQQMQKEMEKKQKKAK